jgi:site-specific recombinase XerD
MGSDLSLFDDVIPRVGNVETLPQALKLYELVGMPAKNLAERTRQEYRNDITFFIEYLAEKRGVTHIAQVSLTDLEAYQAEMDAKSFTSSTRNRKTHAIKAFFKFLYRQEITTTDVSSRLIPPSPQKKEPRFLSKDEYQRLLRSVGHSTRDYAIIETYLQTGMRLSELAKLKISDLDVPKRISKDEENVGLARVKRKGGRSEGIVLNYKACQALSSYLKVRPPVPHNYVFVSKFNRPFNKRGIQHMISKHLEDCGITGASVHTLRHTFATHHVANGTDLKTVQETLGHATLDTTTIYVSLAKKAQRKALQEHAL